MRTVFPKYLEDGRDKLKPLTTNWACADDDTAMGLMLRIELKLSVL